MQNQFISSFYQLCILGKTTSLSVSWSTQHKQNGTIQLGTEKENIRVKKKKLLLYLFMCQTHLRQKFFFQFFTPNIHYYAQHVSGTSMPIIRSLRLYVCYYRLWCAVLRCWLSEVRCRAAGCQHPSSWMHSLLPCT